MLSARVSTAGGSLFVELASLLTTPLRRRRGSYRSPRQPALPALRREESRGRNTTTSARKRRPRDSSKFKIPLIEVLNNFFLHPQFCNHCREVSVHVISRTVHVTSCTAHVVDCSTKAERQLLFLAVKMPPKKANGSGKLTKEEERMLLESSRHVSKTTSALFYGNAFIVSALPLCELRATC